MKPTTARQPIALPCLKVADISTAHLQISDLKIINNPEALGVSMVNEYGALIYLPSDQPGYAERKRAGYSAAFLRILRLAARAGCSHVRFDGDAPVVDGLEAFSHEEEGEVVAAGPASAS